jgi:tyrosyl-tRNA synthetase
MARADWETQFSQKKDPNEIPEVKIEASRLLDGKMGVCPLLVAAGVCASNNEARRKIEESAVSVGPDRRKVTDPKELIAVESGLVLRLGRKIARVQVS